MIKMVKQCDMEENFQSFIFIIKIFGSSYETRKRK